MPQANLAQSFLSEVIGFATDAGIVPITRAEMHRLCLKLGQTPRQADAAAFALWVRPLTPDQPGPRVSDRPLTAEEAFRLCS